MLQVREYLEKHFEETSGDATAKLALKALTETVEASSKNIEVAVTTKDAGALPMNPSHVHVPACGRFSGQLGVHCAPVSWQI